MIFVDIKLSTQKFFYPAQGLYAYTKSNVLLYQAAGSLVYVSNVPILDDEHNIIGRVMSARKVIPVW